MDIILKFFDIVLSAAAIIGGTGAMEAQGYPDGYTPPARISYVETDARQEGNELVFGNLAMELPEGVTAGIEADDDMDLKEGRTIRLDGAELVGETDSYFDVGPFPPLIGMAYCTAEYECEEALICALFDVFPGANLRVRYEDGEKNEYFFEMYEPDARKYDSYVIVRGGDLYLIRQYCKEFGHSFGTLWRQGRVKWQDSDKVIEYETNVDAVYFQVTPEEDMPLLCCDGPTGWSFYREGYFDRCYASVQTSKSGWFLDDSDVTDINYDGFIDIDLGRDGVLLWDPMKKEYIRVEYPEDMPSQYTRESFPETKAIWAYDHDYLSRPHNSNNMDYTESLWQWEDFTPVKRRECRAEIREDGVRILAYEEGAEDPMFDESFALEEWEEDGNERIRVLYRQFYDGLVPEGSFLTAENRQAVIPQGLLDEITVSMDHGAEPRLPEARANAVRLTDEECYAAAGKNGDIRASFRMIGHSDFIMMKADLDNDGIDDIIGQFDEGGTVGSVEYVFFQGQTDGTYIETDSFLTVREEFDIIEYDGKNYLIRTLYDHGREFLKGYSVMAFEEGLCTEETDITRYVQDYALKLARSEAGYEALARQVMEHAVLYDRQTKRRESIVGSAEEIAEEGDSYFYVCDLDNDGEPEYYDKYVYVYANLYARDSLSFTCEDPEDEGVALIQEAIYERRIWEDPYCHMMLWADEANGRTVVSVLYQTSLEDFVIVGYVIDGTEIFEVYEIVAEAALGVKQTRMPQSDV